MFTPLVLAEVSELKSLIRKKDEAIQQLKEKLEKLEKASKSKGVCC